MGWEFRGGRAYYYRACRIGDRVVKEYVGAGPLAERAARADEAARDRAAADAAAVARETADLDRLATALGPLDALVDVVARGAMLAAGYHRHHRGDWRKRRDTPARDAAGADARAAWSRPTAEIHAVVRRAEAGDTAALPELRRLLAAPGAADALGGNLARRAEDTLLTAFAGSNLAAREAVAHTLATLRSELAGPAPSAVERVLAERAACCWLHLYHLETVYAGKGSLDLRLATCYQTAIDRAHRRYLSALKALVDVRRTAPPVQVNIARNQVNVTAPAGRG